MSCLCLTRIYNSTVPILTMTEAHGFGVFSSFCARPKTCILIKCLTWLHILFKKKCSGWKEIPKEKGNCLPAEESLKHNSLLCFISPCRRNVHLYLQSFNKGTIYFYSVLPIWLMRIMLKENKKEVELTR